MKKVIAFLFNLLQDVNALRPLVYLAAADFESDICFLVSDGFLQRDLSGMWLAELHRMRTDVSADYHVFGTPATAGAALADAAGVLIAGSESTLSAHQQVHEVFRVMAARFLRVTLQHGFQCVGFLHNQEHQRNYGSDVRFAADVLCGWFPIDRMTSLHPSQRSKFYLAGPQSVMLKKSVYATDMTDERTGLVCENLHSLRFSANTVRRIDFMEAFQYFCEKMAALEQHVHLRPHPGGQYSIKHNLALPANAVIENGPMYHLDLTRFGYGISAPSTVILDMVLAGVPTAVWIDPGEGIDVSHYAGLATVSHWTDWVSFASADNAMREGLLARQQSFLESWRMPLDPSDVRTRFARLLAGAGMPMAPPPQLRTHPSRILFLSNAIMPTLSIFYLQPLTELNRQGRVEYACVTEEMLSAHFPTAQSKEAADWLGGQIAHFAPDLIVGCRYNGPHSGLVLDAAARLGIPVLYLIDDDLLNVPREIGLRKYKSYRSLPRRDSLTAFLNRADLVHCATPMLMDQLAERGLSKRLVAGDITSAAPVRRRPTRRLRGKIGYMGFDHAHDLQMVLPSIIQILDRYPAARFELLGAMPLPDQLIRFGDRITVLPPIRDYAEFTAFFSQIDWDIGICPLVRMSFNLLKTNVKWVDYTAAGIAVVASAGTVYDHCCADGCGTLASDEAEWTEALETLLVDHDRRYYQTERAQARLLREHSPERFRQQMLSIFDIAAGRRFIEGGSVDPDVLPPALTTRMTV